MTGAGSVWKAGLILSLLSAAATAQDKLPLKITIVVYDRAQIGAKMLDRSEEIAGLILQTAGIESRWEFGSEQDLKNLITDFTAYSRHECEDRPASSTLLLEIVARAPFGGAAQALGFSLPCAKQGLQAKIYADRAAAVSQTAGLAFSRVLGHAIAHELGHVLLHGGVHNTSGLMKGVWSKRDWQRAAVSVIPFSTSEAEQIAWLNGRR